MREYTTILFDLDGTLTDSAPGITRCAALALEHFGIEVKNKEDLRVFIGPPLRVTFPQFGVKDEDVEEAILTFRAEYNKSGKFENAPYEGVREMLETLKKEGFRLFVATSKPEEVAVQILQKFDLARYFEVIAGAAKDYSRETKDAVIQYLLDQIGDTGNMVMVGDTAYDVEGAGKLNIPCIAVTWGFGDLQEMMDAGALCSADTPQDLTEKLLG